MLQVLTFMPCPHWVLCPLKVGCCCSSWAGDSLLKGNTALFLGRSFMQPKKKPQNGHFYNLLTRAPLYWHNSQDFPVLFALAKLCESYFKGLLLLVSWAGTFNFLALKLPFVPHYVSKVVQATIKELHGQFVWKMGSFFIFLAEPSREQSFATLGHTL